MGYWALYGAMSEYTRTLAGLLQCPTDSSADILECLRSKDAGDILKMKLKLQVTKQQIS